jgi:hypothetical protein
MLARASWNSKIVFSIDAVKECILWLKNVERLNEIESQLCQLTYNEAQDAYIFCDASDKGFGGHLTTGSDDESLEMFGSWSLDEQVQSSTWRELAVTRVSAHFSTGLQGRTIRVYTYNKNVAHTIIVGSRKISLHKSVMSVHELCKSNSIKLSIVWIPRKYN